MKLIRILENFTGVMVVFSLLAHSLVFSAPKPQSTHLESPPLPTDEIIVTLTMANGVRFTITADDLKIAIKAAPKGRSVEEILTLLIEFTILNAEAQVKGYYEHPRARDELMRAATRHFITDDFEVTHRIETLPKSYVDQATQKNMTLFRHPELRRADHLLIKPKGTENAPITEEQAKTLHPYAERANDEFKRAQIGDARSLKAQLDSVNSWLPEGYEAIFESLGRFSRRGPYVDSFSEPCFSINESSKLIGPVRTPFGFHFIWVAEIIPALDTADIEIDRAVRTRILPEVRGYEWQKLLTTLVQRASK